MLYMITELVNTVMILNYVLKYYVRYPDSKKVCIRYAYHHQRNNYNFYSDYVTDKMLLYFS